MSDLANILAGCGSILGTIINGWLVTAYGPRKVVLGTLCVMTCFLFIVFFAPSKQVLLVGELLLGLEWGIVSCTFLSTIVPDPLLTNNPVRNHGARICVGSPTPPNPSILHLVHEHVLHLGSIHLCGSSTWPCSSSRRVGLQNSLCRSMDLAYLPYPTDLVCSRVAVSSCSTKQA